ncbi:hypothetical protein ACFVGM_14880 [Kitasatospora purpeofusca]
MSELRTTATTVTVLTVLPITLLLALTAWAFPHRVEPPPPAGPTPAASP